MFLKYRIARLVMVGTRRCERDTDCVYQRPDQAPSITQLGLRHWSRVYLPILSSLLILWMPTQIDAQNLGSSGSTWGGSWQFQSASARSVNIQQADTIKRAESGFYASFGPAQTTIHNNTTNDNRSNYVEVNAEEGADFEITNRVGDEIGKVSNVTGAINTGSTDIRVDGSSNTVTAINSSDSHGCLDGSINVSNTHARPADPTAVASLLNAAAGFNPIFDTATSVTTGGSQSGCVTR